MADIVQSYKDVMDDFRGLKVYTNDLLDRFNKQYGPFEVRPFNQALHVYRRGQPMFELAVDTRDLYRTKARVTRHSPKGCVSATQSSFKRALEVCLSAEVPRDERDSEVWYHGGKLLEALLNNGVVR